MELLSAEHLECPGLQDEVLLSLLGEEGQVDSGNASPSEPESHEDDPPLLEIIRWQLDSLTSAEVAHLAANLAKLKVRCRDGVPYASGCSGTGMDDHATDLVAEEAHRRFGIGTRWRSLFQVEKDARKRRWLNHFTSSDALLADVNELRQGPAVDTRSGMKYGLPD